MQKEINLSSRSSLTKKYGNHSSNLKSNFVKDAKKGCRKMAKPVINVRNKT